MGEPVVDYAGDGFERGFEKRYRLRVGERLGSRLRDEREHGTVVLVREGSPMETKIGEVGEGCDCCRGAVGEKLG